MFFENSSSNQETISKESSKNSSSSDSKRSSMVSKNGSISIIGSRNSQQSLGSTNLRPQSGSGQKIIKSSEESIGSSQNRVNESDVELRRSSYCESKSPTKGNSKQTNLLTISLLYYFFLIFYSPTWFIIRNKDSNRRIFRRIEK